MKRVFSIPESVHTSGKVLQKWQSNHGNYLAVAGSAKFVTIYDRHGELKDEVILAGACTGLAWDKDGDTLAIGNDKSGVILLWDASTMKTTQLDSGFSRDAVSLVLWSKISSTLAVGTMKGNLLIYDHRTTRKTPIIGKHTQKITNGAWSNEDLLALGSLDKNLTINKADGDLISQTATRMEPEQIQFASMKTDERSHGENTISLTVGGKTLFLFDLQDPENPIELAFQARYGNIVSYRWFGDGYIMIGFATGFLVVISTHIKEIGQELFQTSDHKDNLTDISISFQMQKAATCGDSSIKIHDLNDLKEIYAIINIEDSASPLDKLAWTDDGQLLAISTEKGAVNVYLTKLPVLGSIHNTRIAYLTSLREVTIYDEMNNESAMVVTTPVEPSFLAVGAFHLAIGMNNRLWFTTITAGDRGHAGYTPFHDREYLGTISAVYLNQDYTAVLFDGRVQLHLTDTDAADNGGSGEEREGKLFPEQNEKSRVICAGLTTEFLVYGTDTGTVRYFYLEEWRPVNEFRHSVGIRRLFPDPVGTRLVFIDDKSDGYIYNPVNDAILEIPSFSPSVKGVLWDNWLLDKGVFCAFDDDKVYSFCYSKDTIAGPQCNLAGTSKLAYGHTPLMLHGGDLTCQTQSGKTIHLQITAQCDADNKNVVDSSNKAQFEEMLHQTLALRRFKDSWNICQLLNEQMSWQAFAEVAAQQLDIDLAIRVFRRIENVAMVLSLEKIRNLEDKSLLAGYVAMFLKDFTKAQDLFLASGSPKAALDMRRDLLHWDEALELAKALSPEQIPFISREYAQQLEFIGDYPNAMIHFEKGVTTNEQNVDHDEVCAGGVARMSIRMGDIRRGVNMAMKSQSKQLKRECAALLDTMKQYSESAVLYEKAQCWDKAAGVYIKLKQWNKVGDLLKHITSPKLLIQFAKAKELDGKYKESAAAYMSAKDHENVIRINLEHLQNPEEAVRIVRETQSVEGAKMVAKFFQNFGDFASAIQFLVMSRCSDEAFNLAQQHDQMEQYADIIGENATPEDYNSIALYFENKQSWELSGKFFILGAQYAKALHHLMRCNVTEEGTSIELAIQAVGKANDEKLTHELIDFLMGEVDGTPKDAKFLFRLYMALDRYREAAKTAVIIAREQQDLGNYKISHDVLFSMYKELRDRKIKIPNEMVHNLMLLHSYILCKIHVKRGDHMKGARMLVRVANSISKFPAHVVPILTSTVIECHRAGMKHSSFSFAAMLMRPEYRQLIDLKYKKKIEMIVRKPDKTEEEEALDACPYCSYQVPQTRLDCPECKKNIPYCIVTGRHMIKDDWCNCPNCQFPAICSEFKSLLEGDDTKCPMCSETVTTNSLKPIKDPSPYLKDIVLNEDDEKE